MKNLILIFSIFLNFSLFANNVNYTADGKTMFLKNKDCMAKNEACYAFPVGQSYSDFELADEMIIDLKSPIHLKDKTITCNDKIDCDAKFLEQSADYCPSDYKHIKNYDLLQIYCYKFGGYEQKLSGNKVLKFNQTKKDARLLLLKKDNDVKVAIKNRLVLLKKKLKDKTATMDEISEALYELIK